MKGITLRTLSFDRFVASMLVRTPLRSACVISRRKSVRCRIRPSWQSGATSSHPKLLSGDLLASRSRSCSSSAAGRLGRPRSRGSDRNSSKEDTRSRHRSDKLSTYLRRTSWHGGVQFMYSPLRRAKRFRLVVAGRILRYREPARTSKIEQQCQLNYVTYAHRHVFNAAQTPRNFHSLEPLLKLTIRAVQLQLSSQRNPSKFLKELKLSHHKCEPGGGFHCAGVVASFVLNITSRSRVRVVEIRLPPIKMLVAAYILVSVNHSRKIKANSLTRRFSRKCCLCLKRRCETPTSQTSAYSGL